MWHKRDERLRKFLEQQRLRSLLQECTAAAAALTSESSRPSAASHAALAAAARARGGGGKGGGGGKVADTLKVKAVTQDSAPASQVFVFVFSVGNA